MDGPGTLRQTEWTPNRLSFDVSAEAPTTLEINQNFDVDWQVESGHGTMTSGNGRLAVEIPAGHQQLTIFYQPKHMLLALLLTMTGWIAFVFLWWWERSPVARSPVSVETGDGQRASAE
jgi:uncharacterized membrane protein YfhO